MTVPANVSELSREALQNDTTSANVSMLSRGALHTDASAANVSEVSRSVLIGLKPPVNVSDFVREVLLVEGKRYVARVSEEVREVLLTDPTTGPGCGPVAVFPTLPVGFPVKIRPVFKTTIGTSVCSRETRWNNQNYPLWEIELLFELLRDQTQNQIPYQQYQGFTEFMTLCQFWLMTYGQGSLFYFDAPWDDSRTDQLLGYGDGIQRQFYAYRTWGAGTAILNELVGKINVVTNVKVGDVIQSPSTYTVNNTSITFQTPPPGGVAVRMTFSFYYLCRFVADTQDFEEFYKNIWTVKSLKFRSVYFPRSS